MTQQQWHQGDPCYIFQLNCQLHKQLTAAMLSGLCPHPLPPPLLHTHIQGAGVQHGPWTHLCLAVCWCILGCYSAEGDSHVLKAKVHMKC